VYIGNTNIITTLIRRRCCISSDAFLGKRTIEINVYNSVGAPCYLLVCVRITRLRMIILHFIRSEVVVKGRENPFVRSFFIQCLRFNMCVTHKLRIKLFLFNSFFKKKT